MGTLVALKGGAYQYMGYSHSGAHNGVSLKIHNNPVINVDSKMLMGILNNHLLLQYFVKNGFILTEFDYRSVLKHLEFIDDVVEFRHSKILMVTVFGDIFLWDEGRLLHIDEEYAAIGYEAKLALGCLHGTGDSNKPSEQRMETVMKFVQSVNPSGNKSVGVERV